MHTDPDQRCCKPLPPSQSLLVRISISDVGYLHKIRDTVLAGQTGPKLTKLLKERRAALGESLSEDFSVEIDLTHFAKKVCLRGPG